MGNAGVPTRRRARLFHLPFWVALRLRMRSNCWVEETMAGLPSCVPTAKHGSCSGARNMKEGRGVRQHSRASPARTSLSGTPGREATVFDPAGVALIGNLL